MKKFLILLIVLAVLCTGCAGNPAETAPSSEEATEVCAPQGLTGSWSSASSGETGYTETITLEEDGHIYVELFHEGASQQIIAGTYHVEGGTIYYSITEGTAPYEGTFRFRLDGRELFLDDSDGTAHYLRNA